MARKAKPAAEDDLLTEMRRAIMTVLANPKADPVDIMKAIEVGAKILAIQHKIRDKRSNHGSFFAAGNAEDE